MKLVGALAASLAASAVAVSPVGKVVQLISELQAKVIKEGESSQKLYAEYSEWCEDRSRSLSHSIKTAASEVEELKAAIAESASSISAATGKVETLAGDIAADAADLKAATQIRDREAADFAKEEAELTDTISTLERAVAILQREMAKGGAAMVQLKSAKGLVQALGAMVQAESITSADAERLTAFVQGASGAESAVEDAADDEALGAPAAAIYEGHSGDIVDTLQGLLEKASSQLGDLRKKETSNRHHFDMLKQSLEDEIEVANKDVDASKKVAAASRESKATNEGDLEATTKDLAADKEAKEDLHHACLTKSEDFEAATKSRGEELNALAEAKKVIIEQTGGAEGASYGAASLLQVSGTSSLASSADLAGFEVVHMLRDLARKQGAPALAQLAGRAATALRRGAAANPFGKVRGLISDMIAKLESEAGADASKKEYCDKEMSETEQKKVEKNAEVDHLSTKIDQMTARSAQLKGEVAELQRALSQLAASQAEMDTLRAKEHDAFTKNEADLAAGLAAVKTALKILNEYYANSGKAHSEAEGASRGIVGLLEVVESDFSKGLAEATAAEDSAASDHDRETRENEIERATREKDVEFKSKESTGLDKASSELSSDRSGVQAELDAILEYHASLKAQCVATAETYTERKSKREAELAGLKEALRVLESETALVQRHSSHRRGALRGHTHLSA